MGFGAWDLEPQCLLPRRCQRIGGIEDSILHHAFNVRGAADVIDRVRFQDDKVGEIAGRPTNLGSVYVTLDRLEAKGYVSSKLTEPLPERGGQPKRFYHMKAEGIRALDESMQASRRVSGTFSESWKLGKWKVRDQK